MGCNTHDDHQKPALSQANDAELFDEPARLEEGEGGRKTEEEEDDIQNGEEEVKDVGALVAEYIDRGVQEEVDNNDGRREEDEAGEEGERREEDDGHRGDGVGKNSPGEDQPQTKWKLTRSEKKFTRSCSFLLVLFRANGGSRPSMYPRMARLPFLDIHRWPGPPADPAIPCLHKGHDLGPTKLANALGITLLFCL